MIRILFYVESIVLLECEPHRYGPNCATKCGHCKDGESCSMETGGCPAGCADGWVGKLCDTRMLYDFNLTLIKTFSRSSAEF